MAAAPASVSSNAPRVLGVISTSGYHLELFTASANKLRSLSVDDNLWARTRDISEASIMASQDSQFWNAIWFLLGALVGAITNYYFLNERDKEEKARQLRTALGLLGTPTVTFREWVERFAGADIYLHLWNVVGPQELQFRLERSEKTRPSVIEAQSDSRWLEAVKAAEGAHAITNDLGYALKSIRHERQRTRTDDLHHDLFTFQHTDYKRFVWPNRFISQEEMRGRDTSELRRVCGALKQDIDPDSLHEVQIDVKAGANVAVITSDGFLLFGARSKGLAVASEAGRLEVPFHLVAEGMLRKLSEADGDVEDQTASPFATARRAMRKEFGLRSGEHYEKDDVECIGGFIDKLRIEYVFAFRVRLRIRAHELAEIWDDRSKTPDRFEHRGLLFVPLTKEAMAATINEPRIGELISGHGALSYGAIDPDCFFKFASNHAMASFSLATFAKFGDAIVKQRAI